MDAGPILRQVKRPLKGDEKAPELLTELFETGVQALLEELPSVFAGEAKARAVPQGEATLTHAAKVSPEEGDLDFTAQTAAECHNKVRAFAGWPGTKATLKIQAANESETTELVLKIITTQISNVGDAKAANGRVEVTKKMLRIPCVGGEWLEVLEVQPPGKKAMPANSFINGLKGASLFI
jgi:methionyl-tRNA formyltransferase